MTYRKLMNQKWVIYLLLFGLFTPQYLSRIVIVQALARGLHTLAYILILAGYGLSIRKHIRKPFNIAMLFLWLGLLFSTVLSDVGSIDNYYGTLKGVLLSCGLIGVIATQSPVNGLRCLYGYFSTCILINTATIFLFPNAMFPNPGGNWVCWFLGEDNVGYLYYIIASTMAMIYTAYVSKRLTAISILTWACAFIFVFSRNIATGIVCQIVWVVLVFGYQFGWFRRLLKGRDVLYVLVGSFVVIVLFRGLIFKPIIAALGKDITFSGRTIIWDRALKWLQDSPWFGFGMYENETFNGVVRMPYIWSAHNFMLTLLTNGGIVAVLLFIVTIICSYKDGSDYRNSAFYRCAVIGTIVLVVRSLTESGYALNIMFMMFSILAYTKEFVQGLEGMSRQKKIVVRGIPKLRLSWRYRV